MAESDPVQASSSTATTEGGSLSPKIQFKEPFDNRRLSGGSSNGNRNRRLSTNSSRSGRSTGSNAVEEDHFQDWTTVTAEKDSWANRERRRSSLFHKMDSYPGPGSATLKPSSPTNSERRGSILSLWSGGKDKKGKDVLYSGDGDPETWDDEDGGALKKTISARKRRVLQPQERRGSVLSIWGKGKDENGRDIILSE